MKETSVKIIKIVNIIVSILTFLMIFFMHYDEELGLCLSDNLKFLPITFLSLSFCFFIAELSLEKRKELIRLCIYCGEIIFLTALFISSDIDLVIFIFTFLGLPNSIISIISFINYLKNDNFEKTLPLGIMNFKHELIISVTTLAIIEIGVVLYSVFDKLNINKAILIAFFPVVFIIFLFVFVKANPLITTLNIINKKLDYNTFSQKLDELMGNNINPQTRSYLETVRANYMLVDDLDEALKYYEDVSVVTDKHYIHFYALVKCNFASLKHNRDEFDEGINLLRPYNKYAKWINNCNISWNVYNSKEEIKDIEKMVNNPSIPFSGLTNKGLLMDYYCSRGNFEKAKELANELKDCPFRQYRKDALKVLNGDENEKQEVINN